MSLFIKVDLPQLSFLASVVLISVIQNCDCVKILCMVLHLIMVYITMRTWKAGNRGFFFLGEGF